MYLQNQMPYCLFCPSCAYHSNMTFWSYFQLTDFSKLLVVFVLESLSRHKEKQFCVVFFFLALPSSILKAQGKNQTKQATLRELKMHSPSRVIARKLCPLPASFLFGFLTSCQFKSQTQFPRLMITGWLKFSEFISFSKAPLKKKIIISLSFILLLLSSRRLPVYHPLGNSFNDEPPPSTVHCICHCLASDIYGCCPLQSSENSCG